MTFFLSRKSLSKLESVNNKLIQVVKRAIETTPIDFAVTCGLRTFDEQQALFDAGKTKTMNSKHLSGLAVDVVAIVDGRLSWDIEHYCVIADAFKRASNELSVPVRWGGSWYVDDIGQYDGTMKQAMNDYTSEQKRKNKSVFIDGPHFELS